jgi:hypothetical protein
MSHAPLADTRPSPAALAAIAGVALAARLAWLLVSPPDTAELTNPLADAGDYHVLATSLMEGTGFAGPTGAPTAFRPPVYPLFLAAVYTLFGVGNLMAVGLVQCVLGALSAVLVAVIGWRAGLGRGAALLAGLGAAVYPPFVFQAAQLLTEELARGQVLLAVLAIVEAWRRGGAWWLLAGFAAGLATLNKSVLAAAMPALAVVALAAPAVRPSRRLVAAALLAIGAAGALLPWTIRNAAVSGRLIPVSTNFPITFAHGVTRWSFYTDRWYGARWELLATPDDFQRWTQLRAYDDIAAEIAVGREWQERARQWIADNPGRFALLTVRKAAHYWNPWVRNRPAVQWLGLLAMGPVLLGGWVGLVLLLRRRAAVPLVATALAIALPTMVPYALSQPDVRYRLALVDPLWLLMAAHAALAMMPRRPHSTEPPATP